MRTRRLAPAALLSTTALVLAGCGGGSLSEDSGDGGDDSVTVGLVLPASGVYEPLGVDMTRGWELYLEQNDGQLGGRDVEVVTADEGEGPDVGVPATTRVITQDQADVVVGIVNSATALGVKEGLASSEVPLIVANAGANDLADGGEWVWRTSFTNGGIAASLGEQVAEDVGDEPVYLMASDYAAGEESIAGFKEAFEAAGGTVAGESLTPFGTTSDYQPFLTRAQNSDAGAIYAFYAGAEAVSFVQQYREFGAAEDLPLYGPGFLTEGGVLEAQGEAAEGVQTAMHYSNLLDTPENTEFVDAYVEAYDAQPTTYAVQAYDAAAALDAALEVSDGTSGADIAAALGEVGEFSDSPRGPWSFDDDHNPEQTYFLREVEPADGQLGNVVQGELN